MPWTAYAIIPIDWAWEFLPTVQEIATRFAASDAELIVADATEFETMYHSDFGKHFALAKRLAREEGWEGDFGGNSPRVIFLPDENTFVYGFVWKQSNNGTTFVVSPQPLPWLEKYT